MTLPFLPLIEPKAEENNVIKLETQKEKEEPEIFDEEKELIESEETPLVLTQEVKEKDQVTE